MSRGAPQYNYFHLIKELAVTDFKLKYSGSVFGYLWSLAKPLMLFAVMYVVFTQVFKLGGTIPNYPVYLLLGIVLWMYFAESTATAMHSIVTKGDLIRKVYFPRIVLVVATSATVYLTFILNLVVVFVFMAASGVYPTATAPIFLLVLIEFYFLTTGISFILASLFVRFRDISHIWDIVLQALFYGTPIIYPLTILSNPMLKKILVLSPLAQIIQDSRKILISGSTQSTFDLVHGPARFIPYVIPFVVFAAGYFIFQSMAASFAEEI